MRHALVRALAGADPAEPVARARVIGAQQGGPAGSGRHDSLLRGILLLVLDRLDDYREAHFAGR